MKEITAETSLIEVFELSSATKVCGAATSLVESHYSAHHRGEYITLSRASNWFHFTVSTGKTSIVMTTSDHHWHHNT